MTLRRAVIAASAAALLTLVACEGSEPVEEGSGAPTPQPETDVESTALTMGTFARVVTDAQLAAGSATLEGTAAFDAQQVDFVGQLDLGAALSESSMSMQMELPSIGSIDLILIDEAFYLNLGEMTQGKYTVVELSDPQGLGALLGGMEQLNLAGQTEGLDGMIEGFDTGATETMDGVEATEYVVTVDSETLYAQPDGPLSYLSAADPDIGPDTAFARLGLPQTLEYSFWVGTDDLPRRMSVDLGASGSVDLDISGWGEATTIEAPPASEIRSN